MQLTLNPIADSHLLVGAIAFLLTALLALVLVRMRSGRARRWLVGLLGGAAIVGAVVGMLRPKIDSDAELFFYPVTGSFLVVGGTALALTALLMFLGPGGKATRRRGAALGAARVLVILLVLLAMLRPTLVYTEIKRDKATLIVLIDRSRSLTIQDGLSGKSRWELLRLTLEDSIPALRDLHRDFEIKAYTFDGEIHSAEVRNGKITLPDSPQGEQTAIGPALEDAVNQETGKRILGIVLLTDGRQQARPPRDTAPQSVAGKLRHQVDPVYAVVFGSRGLGGGQDVAVENMRTEPANYVFVKNELTVLGQVRVSGFVNREVPVRVLFETRPGEMEVVAQEKIKATTDGQAVAVRFSYTVPDLPGEHKVVLEAVRQPGEQVTTNNEQTRFITVLKGGLRVLYLEGSLRREAGSLRRSLDASEDIKVDYVRIDPRRPETRPPGMESMFGPGKYDVYIVGDLDASGFGEPMQENPVLKALAEAVDRGAGLIMLGGMHSFGAGHYGETPLAQVLPVKMTKLEVQPLGEPIREDLHLRGPVRMVPTPFGVQHFALSLNSDPRENARLWDQLLPPLDGANRFSGLDSKAVVLADSGGNDPKPLLVSRDYGNGRVMAFAGDSTWRWPMHGYETAHKRFWRQIVLWLAHKEQAGEGKVWVKVENSQVAVGDRVDFSAGTTDKDTGGPLKDVDFQVQVIVPPKDARVQGLLVLQGERMIGSFRETTAPGDYIIEVKATQKGKPVGEARARFSVAARDLELDNPAADPDTMESVAKMTGGKAVAPEQLSDLIRQLASQTQHLETKQETRKTIWDTWGFFSMLIGLLSVEWYLRKRWGMV